MPDWAEELLGVDTATALPEPKTDWADELLNGAPVEQSAEAAPPDTQGKEIGPNRMLETPALRQGLSFGLSDEIRGLAAAVGPETLQTLVETGDLKQTWDVMRREYTRGQQDAQAEIESYREENPIWAPAQEIVGTIISGGSSAGAKPLLTGLGKYGRYVLEGMGLGTLAGFGFAEPDKKLQGTLTGTVVGGGAGLITPLASKAGGRVLASLSKRPKPPQLDALREMAKRVYEKADDVGLVIAGESFKSAADDLGRVLTEQGIDPTLHPRATAAYRRIVEAASDDLSLKQFDVLRRVARGATKSLEPDERRIGGIIIDYLDDYIENVGANSVKSGDPQLASSLIREARNLWSRMRKGEVVEGLLERAANRAQQFSGSGLENAIRTEFRNLAQNAKRMRVFTKAEQNAIRKVARGGTMENALRMLGKFAPRGIVSTTLGGGAGYMLGGPAGSAALLLAAEAGRAGATVLTKRNARLASELMRRGAPAAVRRASPTATAATRNLLMRGGAAAAGQAARELPE